MSLEDFASRLQHAAMACGEVVFAEELALALLLPQQEHRRGQHPLGAAAVVTDVCLAYAVVSEQQPTVGAMT